PAQELLSTLESGHELEARDKDADDRHRTYVRIGFAADQAKGPMRGYMDTLVPSAVLHVSCRECHRALGSGKDESSGATKNRRTFAVRPGPVRDADNGAELERALRERFGFDARTITGDEEAHMTYLGATSGWRHAEPLLVVDIGGGSTEFVVGRGDHIDFHVST